MKDRARQCGLGFLVAGLMLFVGLQQSYAGQEPGHNDGVTLKEWLADGDKAYSKNGLDVCTDCHNKSADTPVLSIYNTAHGQMGDSRSPLSTEKVCETCHGPSEAHGKKVDDEADRPAPAVNFSDNTWQASPSSVRNEVCLGCHEKQHINWRGSPHDLAEVDCASCHTVHASKDPMRDNESQQETCYGCHQDKKVEMSKAYRHPLKEGDMSCSDCHNTHGSAGPSNLKEQSVNETCYNCHAEKRGPFLFEHEPVQDSCVNCHTPHGSSNQRLLTVRTPFLCQQCHVASRHVGTQYGSASLNTDGDNTGPGSSSRLTGTGCMNCHTQVHGSNHPAAATLRR